MSQVLKKIIIGAINLYQRTLSPDHGFFKARHPHGFCRYYPSCSEYTKQAVTKFGPLEGLWVGFKRVLRCNPWAEPSVDVIEQA